jgi:hypothetical protein
LRVAEPAFKSHTKVRRDEKVNNRPQVNNAILRITRVHSKHFVIRNIVIRDGTRLLRHSKLQNRLSESYTKYKRVEEAIQRLQGAEI